MHYSLSCYYFLLSRAQTQSRQMSRARMTAVREPVMIHTNAVLEVVEGVGESVQNACRGIYRAERYIAGNVVER